VALVHPRDIAAEKLASLAAPAGRTICYVASDERTQDEITHALGAAIGTPRPALGSRHQQATARQPPPKRPARTAADIVDIYASMNSGALAEDYEQHKPTLSKVKLEDFAREFVAAF